MLAWPIAMSFCISCGDTTTSELLPASIYQVYELPA